MKIIIGVLIIIIMIYIMLTNTEKKIEINLNKSFSKIFPNLINEEKFSVISNSPSPNSESDLVDNDNTSLFPDSISDIGLLGKNNPLSPGIALSPSPSTAVSQSDTESENQLSDISNTINELNNNESSDNLANNRSKSIEDILNEYMDKNEECNSKLINDKSYENKFTKSFKNYVSTQFKNKIGYIPEFTRMETLDTDEFENYIQIVSELPICNELMNKYNEEVIDDLDNKQEVTGENDIDKIEENDSNRDYTDKLLQNQEIINKLVKNSQEKHYVNSDNTENKMFNDKFESVDIGKSFNFKPNIKFNHNEPSKKIASAYGWSFMPPQTWSVPQQRPPVCIPDNDKQSTVKAIYDKGTPVDALDWVKSGAILPQTEYAEKYNENYYYPGWKAQDHVVYPFKNENGTEYYNYNLAKEVE